MWRSKKISTISILAILVSIISLVSSGIALSATLNTGVSSIINKNDIPLSSSTFAIHLENKEYRSTNKEVAFLHNEVEIKDNELTFGVTFLKREGEITIPISIINEGNVEGKIKNIQVIGLPEHFLIKRDGVEIGTILPINSKKEATFSITYISLEENDLVEPEVYEKIQIIFDIEK